MRIAVVGGEEFTLGFQLSGVGDVHNPESDEDLHATLRGLLSDSDIGIVVLPTTTFASLPERLRFQLSASVSPTVLGIGTEEDTTLRDTIRRAIGVDLWK